MLRMKLEEQNLRYKKTKRDFENHIEDLIANREKYVK